MTENYLDTPQKSEHIESIKHAIDSYLAQCVKYEYPYRFFPAGVSGVFSDNAPPNPAVIHNIHAFNERYGDTIQLHMVTLEEFYHAIKDEVCDAPVYSGDLTDWWAHGVGSTSYAVKHYKEAQRVYHLCHSLDTGKQFIDPDIERHAEDNLLLFAEHTWGHSATITDPYITIVNNIDIRNISYASKAHEASYKNLYKILKNRGDKMRYYDHAGRIKAIHTSDEMAARMVSFYIETYNYEGIKLCCEQTKR